MSGFSILYPSWSIGATITSNSELTALPASNLGHDLPSKFYRSAADTGIQITIDTLSPKGWQGLALLYHTISSSGTIQITSNASTGTLFSSPSYDGGAESARFAGDLSSFSDGNHFWHDAGSLQTYRYIGIQIEDGSNPDSYVDAGVVMIGGLFTPSLGPTLGSASGMEEFTEHLKLGNGANFARYIRGDDIMELKFSKQSIDDAVSFQRIRRAYGSHIPLVFKWDPQSGNYEQEFFVYGYAEWQGLMSLATGSGRRDLDVSIRQI